MVWFSHRCVRVFCYGINECLDPFVEGFRVNRDERCAQRPNTMGSDWGRPSRLSLRRRSQRMVTMCVRVQKNSWKCRTSVVAIATWRDAWFWMVPGRVLEVRHVDVLILVDVVIGCLAGRHHFLWQWRWGGGGGGSWRCALLFVVWWGQVGLGVNSQRRGRFCVNAPPQTSM
jgi:hypothetical protein